MPENLAYELLTLRRDTAGHEGHWQRNATSPYGKNSIEESNSTSTTEPTSIPSPFARMELARSAFEIAAACDTWEEVPKRYQKIVSDCLDVAEIFFNFPMYSKYIKIIKWEKANLSKKPLKDTELGKAMNKFIQGDNGTYHFDRLNAIYLLNYVGDNRPNKTGLNIIGATSPITMFFSVDNDLSYVSKYIHFTNGDKPFDKVFNPLEKRDIHFIQYMAGIKNRYKVQTSNNFATDFKAFHDYIVSACNNLPEGVNPDNPNVVYKNIPTDEGTSDFVNVLGCFIGSQVEREPQQSDFEIDSPLVKMGKLPLVLPAEAGNAYENCAYMSVYDMWGPKNYAPAKDNRPLDARILPGTNIKYPYLTVSDFFEDTIIKMPYKLNSKSFFDGNIETDSDKSSFLLPLTPTFFKYFTVDELRTMIKMRVSGPVVTITLNIPIKNHTKKSHISHVTYKKTYQTNENEVSNMGSTETAKFGLGVFPLVKSDDVNVADYRVALFDKVGISDVKFYDVTEEIVLTDEQKKERREYNEICGIKTFVVSKHHFDRIDITYGNAHGYIVPIFEDKEGTKKFKFAVDFGTTNTHIAYSIVNELESSALKHEKPQMVRLHESYNADRDITTAFDDNYVPNQFIFPIRSAFSEARPIEYRDKTYTLSDGNIPFRYEKVGPIEYLDVQTGEDLKWSANKGRLELYIRNIAFILHNKVLIEKGKLKDVQIRWFYPASMSTFVRNMMEQAWNKAYKDYFDADYVDGNGKIISMSESIAPYCHYINRDEAMGIVTTIDVGGGTTDVYILDGQRNEDGSSNDGLLLSFRFASNAIFGDGYNNNINNNGFVKKYRKYFEDALKGEEALSNAMKNIALKGNSSELISFFFSLASQDKPGLDFLDKLVNDQKFKYVFLVFYSAIIYHVAQTMKAKGIGLPQTVAFSGNGSKTLQVISQNHGVLEEFVKNIFEKVYGETYPRTCRFYLKFDNEKPKEATANGGLEATAEQADANPELVVMLGTDNNTFVTNEQYNRITDKQKADIVKSVTDFIEFIPTLNINNAFGQKYFLDVTILNEIVEICQQNLSSYLELGLDKVGKLIAEDPTQTNDITESLFFYPIVGMLNNLAKEIYAIECNSVS